MLEKTTRIRRSKARGSRRENRVTIKDLARDLGLSITTISRALNGYSDVSEKTRLRVVEAVRESGYQPNRSAQRLVTQRTHSLGWIKDERAGAIADPHFVEVFAGVLRACRTENYDLVFAAGHHSSQTSAYDRSIREHSVDGFIVDLPQPRDPRITFLLDAEVPFVVHGRESRSGQYSWVDIDNAGIFKALAGLMFDNGHRHIALINGDEHFAYAIERRKGVNAAIRQRDLSADSVTYLSTTHPMGLAGYQLTEQALADPSVTAILYSSTIMAMEGQAAVSRAGRVAGEDLAVATMDDGLRHVDLSPYQDVFTFARSPLRDAGEKLVDALVARCERDEPPSGKEMDVTFHIAQGLDSAGLPKKWRPAKAA
jgi:LacI family transcriptional regulator